MNPSIKIPKYLFLFNEGIKQITLPGQEIFDYWNTIYDLFWEEGDMFVQKLNGKDFTKKEIKELFWDLYENMSDDLTIIELKVISFSYLEFHNLGEINVDSIKRKGTGYKLDKAKSKNKDEFIHNSRYRICKKYFSKAMNEYNKKKCEKLSKGFQINNPSLLRKLKYNKIKNNLSYYQEALSNKDKWSFNLYHIIDNLGTKTNKISEVKRLLNDKQIYLSRHEGQGIRKELKMRSYTKKEMHFCNKTIRKIIEDWIVNSGINDN
jgi:hypothetical protein